MSHDYENRLVDELSPYLKQHAYNPVDWYPWGDEAFDKAKAEDKPIFLSIGYSTCHWCHVMERESFEDIEVAGLLNEDFISIKVDREERPDIDGVYMTVTQMMTGGGGWPMTVIMTPDKEPFFAGTYIPKSSKWGRPGMTGLLPKIVSAWKNDRERIQTTTGQVKDALANINNYQSGEGLDIKDVDTALKDLRSRYDKSSGGFGDAPKFPTPHNLLLALRRYSETDDHRLLQMVEGTLLNMRLGGIWDHVGFGFHRYSTDREWLLPHFEKMLYDQALLLLAYAEAYQVTGKEIFAQTAREIMTYVMRDMQDANGGYYSAEDADSEGEEGKFYIWTTDELREHLGDRADAFIAHHRAKDDGNFRDESSGKQHPANILHLKSFEKDEAFSEDRQKLFEIREKRIHPLKDRKVLTDWNGLMIGAAAFCGKVLSEEKYIESAKRAADFALDVLRDENGRLYKRSFDGQVGLDGLLDDYAFMVWGLTELYEATWEADYLTQAVELNEIMLSHFSDGDNGFFLSPDDGETVLVRQQEIYDGAVPSGNSVAAMNLLRLGHLTGHTDLLDRAEGLFKAFSSRVSQSPGAHTFLLTAVDFYTADVSEVVIYGDPDSDEVKEMRTGMHSNYLPHAVVVHVSPDDKDLVEAFPHLKSLLADAKPPTAFVCRNFACQQPTSEPKALGDALK